eukprot:4565569-Amphidinium_carterae.1
MATTSDPFSVLFKQAARTETKSSFLWSFLSHYVRLTRWHARAHALLSQSLIKLVLWVGAGRVDVVSSTAITNCLAQHVWIFSKLGQSRGPTLSRTAMIRQLHASRCTTLPRT